MDKLRKLIVQQTKYVRKVTNLAQVSNSEAYRTRQAEIEKRVRQLGLSQRDYARLCLEVALELNKKES